jgi:hypothetical protein
MAGRRKTRIPLDVFLNGRLVGELRREASGAIDFQYAPAWLEWDPAPGGSYSHIDAAIRADGQIIMGNVTPIRDAGVAHGGKRTLVVLRKRRTESVADLLVRLDLAIASAQSTGRHVD